MNSMKKDGLNGETMSDIDIVTWLLSIRHNDRSVELHCLEAADEIERLRKERDEAWLEKGRIMNEIDCRIEHGADSNGHLEAIRKLFSKQALEKMTRLDEEMGLL